MGPGGVVGTQQSSSFHLVPTLKLSLESTKQRFIVQFSLQRQYHLDDSLNEAVQFNFTFLYCHKVIIHTFVKSTSENGKVKR